MLNLDSFDNRLNCGTIENKNEFVEIVVVYEYEPPVNRSPCFKLS